MKLKQYIPSALLLGSTLALLPLPMTNSQAITFDELQANPARYTNSYDSLNFAGRYDFYPNRTFSTFVKNIGSMPFNFADTYWDSLATKLLLSAPPYYFVTTERYVLWEDDHLMRIRLIQGFSTDNPNNGWFVGGDIRRFTRAGQDKGSLLPANVANNDNVIYNPYLISYNGPLFHSLIVNQSPNLLEYQINELVGQSVFATPTVDNDPLWQEHAAYIAAAQSKLKTPPTVPLTQQSLPSGQAFWQENSQLPWPTAGELQSSTQYTKISETAVPELNQAVVSTYLDTQSLKLLWQNDEDVTALGTLYDLRQDTSKIVRTQAVFSLYKTPKAPVSDMIYMIHLLSATRTNGAYTVGGANRFRQLLLPDSTFYKTVRPLLYRLQGKAAPVPIEDKEQKNFQDALQKGVATLVGYGEENISAAQKRLEAAQKQVSAANHQASFQERANLQQSEQDLRYEQQKQEDLKNYQTGKTSLAQLRQKSLALAKLW